MIYKIIPLIFSILIYLIITPITYASSETSASINVYIDGAKISFTEEPFLLEGTTMVQFVPVFKKLGLNIKWDQETQSVMGEKEGLAVKLTIGDPKVLVNGVTKELTVPPLVHNGSTFIPLRFIGEATDKDVIWDSQTFSVKILTPFADELFRLAFTNRVNQNSMALQPNVNKNSKLLGVVNGDQSFQIKSNYGSVLAVNHFDDDKVSWLYYMANDKYVKNVNFIENYRKMKELLIQTYGTPIYDKVTWVNDTYKNDTEKGELALSEGHVSYSAGWETSYMSIILNVKNDDGHKILGVYIIEKKTKQNEKDDSLAFEKGFNFGASSNNFRGTKWGMSREDVLNKESATLIKQSESRLLYHVVINNIICLIDYKFTNNQLIQAAYYISEKSTTEIKYIDLYDQVKQDLTKAYGEPSSNIMNWKNDEFKNNIDKWETSIINGNLSLLTDWTTSGSTISLFLSGDGSSKSLLVNFKKR